MHSHTKGGFMSYTTITVNEIQPLVLQIFGNRRITAITTDNTMVLTATEKDNVNQNTAMDKLCGMFKNTRLLSSDDFAKNKGIEKKLEERKFGYE